MQKNLRKIKEKSDIIYENDSFTAFIFSKSSNAVHIIILPNKKLTSLEEINNENIINQMITSVKLIIDKLDTKVKDYRLILNSISKETDEIYFNLIVGEKLGQMFENETKPKIRDPILYKSDLNYII